MTIKAQLIDIRDSVFGSCTALYECYTDDELVESYEHWRETYAAVGIVKRVEDWAQFQVDMEIEHCYRDGIKHTEMIPHINGIKKRLKDWIDEGNSVTLEHIL